MRTTLTIEDDVLAKARAAASELGLPFKKLVNRALRIGLEAVVSPAQGKPYRTEGHPMGLRPGISYDNVAELLSLCEREDHK